jgi:hypothetical protein
LNELKKTIKFYLRKLATDFYSQPSYLLGERAAFWWSNLSQETRLFFREKEEEENA